MFSVKFLFIHREAIVCSLAWTFSLGHKLGHSNCRTKTPFQFVQTPLLVCAAPYSIVFNSYWYSLAWVLAFLRKPSQNIFESHRVNIETRVLVYLRIRSFDILDPEPVFNSLKPPIGKNSFYISLSCIFLYQFL